MVLEPVPGNEPTEEEIRAINLIEVCRHHFSAAIHVRRVTASPMPLEWADNQGACVVVQILQEDAEEEGLHIPPPPASATKWSEKDIRKYFETKGTYKPAVVTDLKEPSSEEFDRWFPGLKRSGTQQDNPDVRVVCFHNAGNAEDMYTSEGTGIRKAASPLLVCCCYVAN